MCNYDPNYPDATQCKKPASGKGNAKCTFNGISWAECGVSDSNLASLQHSRLTLLYKIQVVCTSGYVHLFHGLVPRLIWFDSRFKAQGGDCVQDTPAPSPPTPSPPSPSPPTDSGDKTQSVCPAHLPAPYSVAGGGCGCSPASKTKTATYCSKSISHDFGFCYRRLTHYIYIIDDPPSGHGKGACRENAAKTSSECYVVCDAGCVLVIVDAQEIISSHSSIFS